MTLSELWHAAQAKAANAPKGERIKRQAALKQITTEILSAELKR